MCTSAARLVDVHLAFNLSTDDDGESQNGLLSLADLVQQHPLSAIIASLLETVSNKWLLSLSNKFPLIFNAKRMQVSEEVCRPCNTGCFEMLQTYATMLRYNASAAASLMRILNSSTSEDVEAARDLAYNVCFRLFQRESLTRRVETHQAPRCESRSREVSTRYQDCEKSSTSDRCQRCRRIAGRREQSDQERCKCRLIRARSSRTQVQAVEAGIFCSGVHDHSF